MWYTIVGAALLAFIEKTAILETAGRLNPTCTCHYIGEYRDPSPEIPSWGHQPVSTWWIDLRVDVAVWAWEHMRHQPATYHWNSYISHPFCNMHNSFWEVRGWPTTRAKNHASVEEQQPDPEKRQDVLVAWTVWAWKHMMHKHAIHYRRLRRMEYCLRWVWDASSAALVLIHSYHRPHVLVASMHVYIGVSRGPQALWPSCRWRQNIYHYNGHATDTCPW